MVRSAEVIIHEENEMKERVGEKVEVEGRGEEEELERST